MWSKQVKLSSQIANETLRSRCRETRYHSVESLPNSQMQPMEVLYFFFTLASGFCNEHFSPVCPMARSLSLHQPLRTRKRNGSPIPPVLLMFLSPRGRRLHLFLTPGVFPGKRWAAGTQELREYLRPKAPGPAGSPVSTILSHLPNSTSSIDDVKTSQTRIFLQWYLFFRNSEIT